jgi:effector-binding domain-containing protein
MTYDVEVRALAPCDTAVIRTVCRLQDVGSVLPGIFQEVWHYLEAAEVPAGLAFGRFTVAGGEIVVEAGFSTAEPVPGSARIQPGSLPGGEAAVCLHEGPYEQVEAAYNAVNDWLEREGREAAGEPWEVYLSPPEETPPRTEVVFPLAAR